MFERSARTDSLSQAPDAAGLPRYRAEVRCRDAQPGDPLHLYEGGDCSPYCLDSLIDLLRSETRATRHALELTFEVLDTCSSPRLQELASRFARAAIPGLRVVVRAQGREPLRVEPPADPAPAHPVPQARKNQPS